MDAKGSAIIKEILEKAKSSNSDACIIYQGHEHLGSYVSNIGREFPHIMSITKLFVSLAVIVAVDNGLLRLDMPAASILSEWKDGPKHKITLRHLLTHVSGPQNYELPSREIYPSSDWVQLALNAELETEPGLVWSYNNKALNLIPEIIARVTGKTIDDYLKENIFDLIGIDRFEWACDPVGHKQGMAGACFKAEDLSKVARLLAHFACWKNERLVDNEILKRTLLAPPIPPERGLSFWPLISQNEIVGWEANGSLGQYLAIFPETRLSGIRIIEPERHTGKSDDYDVFYPLMVDLHKSLM